MSEIADLIEKCTVTIPQTMSKILPKVLTEEVNAF